VICEKDSELWFGLLHTISTGQTIHQDSVKKNACGAFGLISLACGAFCFVENLPAAHYKKIFLNLSVMHFFQVSYSVYQFIGGENDSNSNTQWSQRHNLYQTLMQKLSNKNPLSNQTSWDPNRTTPIQFQKSL